MGIKSTEIKKSNHHFIYPIKGGTVMGDFNIYQGRNGAVYIKMGNCYTKLTTRQVAELFIDLYALIDFDNDAYLKYYKTPTNG